MGKGPSNTQLNYKKKHFLSFGAGREGMSTHLKTRSTVMVSGACIDRMGGNESVVIPRPSSYCAPRPTRSEGGDGTKRELTMPKREAQDNIIGVVRMQFKANKAEKDYNKIQEQRGE
jgi:hypothetical protein